jgi:hypothetical protein
MTIDENAKHHNVDRLWERKLHQPYDYANDGLLGHLMSPRITQSKNPITVFVLRFVENSLVYAMKYVDKLYNFFNYNWKNR